ncbi:essential MCU regulator, mitochondrial [Microcaecilia unicolor]|uniref:Essential MCU regulator, mitochondrial n=1 Tax=Microcaecilia unicolor TaxID=1415580 RepID=A0A6P7WRM4_9AMPH|nr:essential MCU regulator, mitochondrial [Microcaecilia unicolor]
MAPGVGRFLLASAAFSLRAGACPSGLLRAKTNRCSTIVAPVRTATVTRTGAILPKPEKTSFGLLRVFIVVIPFLYLGTQISKSFAALLEEHDIFVPEDDDDDD